MPTELADDARDGAGLRFRVINLQHIFDGERLEVEPISGVVVGGDRLRVAVDHDGFVSGFAQRLHSMDAGVIELDPLSDPVRTGSKNEYGLLGA